MLELLKVPYVGCGVLASAVGMDKVYSKIIFKDFLSGRMAGIETKAVEPVWVQ